MRRTGTDIKHLVEEAAFHRISCPPKKMAGLNKTYHID